MKVSVIMAAYNAEKYIWYSIDSILNQTYTDFEFIIVNDGSTDSTLKTINSFNDKRLNIIDQNNQGCANARTRAINLAKGEYIAIMDADDIALPKRLEKTIQFLDTHPDHVLVSTGFKIKNEETGEETVFHHPTTNAEIRRALLKNVTFLDPANLIRAKAFKKVGGYKVQHMFDYDLYSRLATIGKMANLPEILAIMRQHNQQFHKFNFSPEAVRKNRLKIKWLILWRLKPSFLLFIQALIWLCFEYSTHLFPERLRHFLPEKTRNFFKYHFTLMNS